MRVAVLSSHTPSLFWFRMDMMRSFIDSGNEVYAIGNEEENKWRKAFLEKGIIYRRVKVQRNGINPIKDLETLVSLQRFFLEIKPEKVFAYQAKTVIYGGFAAKLTGIHDVYPLIAGMGSLFLSNSVKTQILRSFLMTEYRFAIKACPAIFFQNHDDEALFRQYRIINKQNVVFLHGSGVNLEFFQKLCLPEKPVFLCISRLIRDKGIIEYLEACRTIKKQYPTVQCLLIGPFDTNPSALTMRDIKPYIDQDIIEYYGEQSDIRPFMSRASVYILPSYREGTPKTVLEAMACGRPVITTDAPGCRETVVNGKNGFLIPVKNVDALVDRMQYFIEHKSIIPRMGDEGRRIAEERFDVRKVNAIICDVMGLTDN